MKARGASKLPRGITRTATGYLASVGIGGGRMAKKRFPPDEPIGEIQKWRRNRKAISELGLQVSDPEPATTLAEDVARYLQAVRAMPTYTERARHLAIWAKALGRDRPRSSVTSVEIRAIREAWRITPRSQQDRRPLAPGTINRRLRALRNLWTVLDGRRAPNPVLEVPECEEPDALPRALPYALIDLILAAMPDRGQGVRDHAREQASKTKARLRVMAYTGIPPASLQRLTPAMVNWADRTVWVPGRRKGRGGKSRLLPLTDEGLAALTEIDRLNAWRSFSTSSVYKSFRRACAGVEAAAKAQGVTISLAGVRPYDLRHSHGTKILQATGDLAMVQALLGLSTIELARRYSRAAVDAREAEAAATVSASLKTDQKRIAQPAPKRIGRK